MHTLSRHLTYANVVATLALVRVVAGGTAYAANTVLSTDTVNGEVRGPDIHNGAVSDVKLRVDESLTASDLATNSVNASELAPSAVTSGDVANNTLTTADILGSDQNGAVSLLGVPNGRCSQVGLSVSGAQVGQVPLLTVKGPAA
jgi:hypothetical protein